MQLNIGNVINDFDISHDIKKKAIKEKKIGVDG